MIVPAVPIRLKRGQESDSGLRVTVGPICGYPLLPELAASRGQLDDVAPLRFHRLRPVDHSENRPILRHTVSEYGSSMCTLETESACGHGDVPVIAHPYPKGRLSKRSCRDPGRPRAQDARTSSAHPMRCDALRMNEGPSTESAPASTTSSRNPALARDDQST